MRFRLARGAELAVETFPPESSAVRLIVARGFPESVDARQVLTDVAKHIGFEVDWSAPETSETRGGKEVTYASPEEGLNGHVRLEYSGSALVGIGVSVAL
jgi:hypothetical protein